MAYPDIIMANYLAIDVYHRIIINLISWYIHINDIIY